MKCSFCHGCMEYVRVEGEQLLYCWLCKRYYRVENQKATEVTKEINKRLGENEHTINDEPSKKIV